MIKYCRTCRILDPMQQKCQLSGQSVNPNADYCTKHQEEVAQCEKCGQGTLTPFYTRDGNQWHTFCARCVELLNTCHFCEHASKCAFEQDPSPLPKMVQKQIRQGNMVQITTVKNPDRIRQTCENGCPCFSQENDCMREYNGCERMKYIYDNAESAGDSEGSAEVHSEIHGQQPEAGSN